MCSLFGWFILIVAKFFPPTPSSSSLYVVVSDVTEILSSAHQVKSFHTLHALRLILKQIYEKEVNPRHPKYWWFSFLPTTILYLFSFFFFHIVTLSLWSVDIFLDISWKKLFVHYFSMCRFSIHCTFQNDAINVLWILKLLCIWYFFHSL